MGTSSCITKTLFLTILAIIYYSHYTFAATHVVGDSQGWGFSISYVDWANGKTFSAGDTLVFNYNSGVHNVVPVSAVGYRRCKAAGPASSSGNDTFTLKKGANYFICSAPGHCSSGMKIQVLAK